MNEIILIKVTDPHSTALRTGAVDSPANRGRGDKEILYRGKSKEY